MSRTTTIVLVVVAAALLVYVLVVQLPKDRAAAQITPTAGQTTTFVWQVSADQVTGLHLQDHAKNRSVTLAKDAQGAWTVTEPEARPADQTAVSGVVNGLTSLTVNSTITTTTDLSAFGVLSPTYTIELSMADGKQLKASIGDKVPTGSGYYLQREGDANVLAVSSFGIDGLLGMLDAPPYAPTAAPALTETPGGTPPNGTPVSSPAPVFTSTLPAATANPSATP